MQQIKFMYKQFLREPLWFKLLILTTLLISIIFSSSSFSNNGYYQSGAKLAAAIFLCAYGIKMRRNPKIAAIFFILVAICIYLIWVNLKLAG
ncbi:hypothetical protein J2T13_001280 [Paenibacillus sp. DS2015]|uniref:hypothetical protein n=1 Tax=Paenibacillus sp. DS2015 TaxID=3373917 RepID=UPI003D1E30C8